MKQNYANNSRKSSRIKEYDNTQEGLFFITICTNKRSCLFGMDSIMHLNDAGRMINQEWLKIAERFSNIILHNYVIMPNHFHAIIQKSLPFMPSVLNNNGQPH